MKTNTKLIAASMSLMSSLSAVAGMSGLHVQSNLGEPFLGSIVVSGAEAQAAMNGAVSVSGNVRGRAVPRGDGTVVIYLSSSSAVNDPVFNFTVRAGNQTRQYTAMISPSRYHAANVNPNDSGRKEPSSRVERTLKPQNVRAAKVKPQQQQTLKPIGGETAATPAASAEAGYDLKPQSSGVSSNPRYYRVQNNENVSAIADRFRPHNISQQRAIRALMAANPRAFRNGRMFKNVTLYIPTASQWHAYANAADRKAAKRRPLHKAKRLVNTLPTDMGNHAAVAPQNTAPQQPPAQPPEPVKQPETPVAPPPAEQPKQPETPVVPPAEQAIPSAPPADVAVVPPASEAMPPMASMPASAAEIPVASAEHFASEPVAEPPMKSHPVTPPSELEPETDWMQLGLMGAGGLAVLGGAAYLLSRRRKPSSGTAAEPKVKVKGRGKKDKNRPVEEDKANKDDDMLDLSSVVAPAAAASAAEAAQRVWNPQPAEPQTFNDQDDNLFEDLSGLAEANTPTPGRERFDLNHFEPQTETAGEAEQNADDWDWVAEEEVSDIVAAEEPQTVAQPAAAEEVESDWSDFAAPAAATAAVAAAAAFDKADKTPVADDFSAESFAVDAPAAAVVQPVVEEETSWEDEIFARDDDAIVLTPEADTAFGTHAPAVDHVEAPASVEVEEPAFAADAMDFNIESDLSAAPVVEAVHVPAAATEDALAFDSDFDSGFSLPEVETPVIETPQVTNDALSFELSETPVAAADLETPVVQADTVSFDDVGLMSFDEPVTAAPSAEMAFEAPAAAEAELGGFDEVAAQPAAVTGVSRELHDFDIDSIQAPAVEIQDPGFVSEAVGMAAPLEAKLELAKMYLEIDDAVAARETLRELIGESSGDVQVQAKQLLDELGG